MKNSLLLFLSIMLLLFGIQKSSILPSVAEMKQVILAKSCSHTKQGFKKPCARKCIKHQSHSEPKGAATTVTDCGQQVYAVAPAGGQNSFYQPYLIRTTIVSDSRQLLSPFLETDHAPPRLS
ncbi:hypothetical protein [Pontibacter populi]|uniref:Uncharacterized protein n=1 Tax=Pontibacter populi TaxID=890055 RepID=A0ABV1RXM6_9BACT